MLIKENVQGTKKTTGCPRKYRDLETWVVSYLSRLLGTKNRIKSKDSLIISNASALFFILKLLCEMNRSGDNDKISWPSIQIVEDVEEQNVWN